MLSYEAGRAERDNTDLWIVLRETKKHLHGVYQDRIAQMAGVLRHERALFNEGLKHREMQWSDREAELQMQIEDLRDELEAAEQLGSLRAGLFGGDGLDGGDAAGDSLLAELAQAQNEAKAAQESMEEMEAEVDALEEELHLSLIHI